MLTQKDALKAKVMRILASELSDEELLMVTIETKDSPIDIENRRVASIAKMNVAKEAYIADKRAKEEVLAIAYTNLATAVKLPKGKELEINDFNTSVAEFYKATGHIADKQKTAVLKHAIEAS